MLSLGANSTQVNLAQLFCTVLYSYIVQTLNNFATLTCSSNSVTMSQATAATGWHLVILVMTYFTDTQLLMITYRCSSAHRPCPCLKHSLAVETRANWSVIID